MAAAAGLALVVGLGDLAILLLYDSRYHQAAWMLPLLALSIWPRVMSNTSEAAMVVIGRLQYATVGNILRFVATVVGIYLGYSWAKVPGAVMAIALRDLPYYAVTNYGLHREAVFGGAAGRVFDGVSGRVSGRGCGAAHWRSVLGHLWTRSGTPAGI